MTGRRALAVVLAACGWIGLSLPLRASQDAIVLQWQPSGAPADVVKGVEMGAAEAQQTATLLGRTVRLEPRAARPFASIVSDAGGVSLEAGESCTFRLSPTPAERRTALSNWTQRSGKSGDFAIALWDASLEQFGASDLNERFTRRFHEPMTEGAWLGWVAVKAAVEAALRAQGSACDTLRGLQFDGHKGAALAFTNGVLRQPLYVVEHGPAGNRVVAEIRDR
jgi:hypothetical protein